MSICIDCLIPHVCDDAGYCVNKELQDAGYQIYKKGEIEQVEEGAPVAACVRLGDLERRKQGNGDQGGVGSHQKGVEAPLSDEELHKLRRHMALWPG